MIFPVSNSFSPTTTAWKCAIDISFDIFFVEGHFPQRSDFFCFDSLHWFLEQKIWLMFPEINFSCPEE